MGNSISFKTNAKRYGWTIGITVFLTIYLISLGLIYDISNYQYEILGVEIIIACAFLLIKVKTTGTYGDFYNLFLLIILSLMMSATLDLINNMYSIPSESGLKLSIIRFLLSSLFCFFIYLLFIAVTGRVRIAALIATTALFIFGFVSYTILILRGSRLTFADLSAYSTAMDVVGGYDHIPLEKAFFLGLISFLCQIPVIGQLREIRFKIKSLQRYAIYIVFLFGFYGLYSTGFENLNYSWNETENSYAFAFLANAKLLNIKPDGSYDRNQVESMLANAEGANFLQDGYDAKEAIKAAFPEYVAQRGTTDPNIIVVMNESLTNLEVFGDLNTEEIFPYIKSLPNTLKGDLFTEVRGGGTADTEYSFLTGNSSLLIPINTRPYQLYVNPDSQNLVRRLENQGYETVAIHPGTATAWNRNNVYEDFGFEHFFDGGAFSGEPYLRNPVLKTDLSTYQKIYDIFEVREPNKPLFIFDVTIQNHGSYSQGYDNLKKIKAYEDLPEDVEEFLSLMKASDNDYGKLIEHFKALKEPTVILMFGDHQPTFESSFIEDALGKSEENFTIQEDQRLQVTPYIIWANYPLPQEPVGSISINYLSTLLLECAGLDKTPYNKFLSEMHKQLLIIDRKGVISKEGDYYSFEDADIPEEYHQLIQDYKNILYYNMIDTANVDRSLFEEVKE